MEYDKRKHPRVACEVESSFAEFGGATPGVHSQAVIQDLSEGGIRFRAARFIPVQNRLLFRLRIPNQKPIEAVAQPAWIRELPSVSQYDIGAKFLSISEEDRAAIQKFVRLSESVVE